MASRMAGRFRFRLLAAVLAGAMPFQPLLLTADQVPVRHIEGLMHGFLALRTLEGTRLADGEMTQVADGDLGVHGVEIGIKSEGIVDCKYCDPY